MEGWKEVERAARPFIRIEVRGEGKEGKEGKNGRMEGWKNGGGTFISSIRIRLRRRRPS